MLPPSCSNDYGFYQSYTAEDYYFKTVFFKLKLSKVNKTKLRNPRIKSLHIGTIKAHQNQRIQLEIKQTSQETTKLSTLIPEQVHASIPVASPLFLPYYSPLKMGRRRAETKNQPCTQTSTESAKAEYIHTTRNAHTSTMVLASARKE